MTRSFILRDGSIDDVIAIADVFKKSFEHTYPNLVGHHQIEAVRAWMGQAIRDGAGLRLAMIGEEIVAFLLFKQGWIDQLYVLPEFQRKGIGKALLCEYLTHTKESLVNLYTLASNTGAIEFYESFGFVITERGMAPDEKVPDVKMVLQRE